MRATGNYARDPKFIHDMTQSREVLAMMDPHTTTFGRKQGCRISRCGAFLLSALFLLSLVATGLLVYHFAPCLEGKPVRTLDEFGESAVLESARSFATATSNKKKIDVRLPRSVVPDSYEITLVPFIWEGNFTFNGEVKILVNVTQDTKNITLHATSLKIDLSATTVNEYVFSANSNKTRNIKIVDQMNDTARQFHVIRLSETLKAGKQYLVYMKYLGYLNDYLEGFYRSSYVAENQTRWIATTQFQPTDARRAFPCFDEPALKATFQISIARPNNMTSISNMPRKGEPQPASGIPNYMWDHYERSVPMSTYLVAFLVTDFEVLKSPDGKFGVWARHSAINQSRYSLDIGPRILKYYENYFQIKFPLPKMDMVAIPDFSAGAMENWGLITYRETAMLYQKGVSTSSSQNRVATVVAHELAHQWFGNLVTPSWWSDLWLNEGFASYVEYIGMDSVEPEWKVLEQFVVDELQNVLGLDALETSHPISVEVDHPEEINEIFDRISYAKGASIIRMMDHFLTTKVFKQGLTNYLNSKAYRSAEQNDLWDALTKQARIDRELSRDVTVKQIMDTWTLQTGYPVITVTRDYEKREATVTQELFTIRNSTVEGPKQALWYVPITYTTEGNRNFNQTKPSKWLRAQPSMSLSKIEASSSQWVIFNVQQTGFYRVNYDNTNWQLIIRHLKSPNFKEIATVNRGQLIDDAMNLAKAGRLDYTTAMDVTLYLSQETEYVPWKSAFTNLGYLDTMLSKLPDYDKFRVYVLKQLSNIYEKIGFRDEPQDPQLTVFTRMDVLNWACIYGHDDCVRNAAKQFQEWRYSPNPDKDNPISPNLKGVVYCTAIRVGGQADWDFIWERYLKTNVGSEKDLLLNAMGCTRETWILTRYLERAVTENSAIRKQDMPRVFNAVANNVIGRSLVFNFLRNNWDRLTRHCGTSLMMMTSIVRYATKKITTKYELKDLLEFAKERSAELGSSTRTILQSVEQAESSIRWLDRNSATIGEWLRKNAA